MVPAYSGERICFRFCQTEVFVDCKNAQPQIISAEKITNEKFQFVILFRFGSDNQVETASLGSNNIILAGSLLKNTEEVANNLDLLKFLDDLVQLNL